MNTFYVFIIRLGLSTVLGFFICRFFFPGTSWLKVTGLVVIMLVMSYLFEYTRKKEGEG